MIRHITPNATPRMEIKLVRQLNFLPRFAIKNLDPIKKSALIKERIKCFSALNYINGTSIEEKE